MWQKGQNNLTKKEYSTKINEVKKKEDRNESILFDE